MSQNGKARVARVAGRRVGKPRGSKLAVHVPVLKTFKMYVGGKFPRSESGRYYLLKGADGQAIANVCSGSRKDFRDAVIAARAAQGGWASRSAYNRGQILYRIAEMLEGRTRQFVDELVLMGSKTRSALKEVQQCVDRLVYYAGWADKYQQIYSSVNSVNSSHFNFSVLEPMGVVSIISPQESGLLGLVSMIAPTICGGNSCVALASTHKPLCAVTFGEVLATSDLPGGVVNILTARRSELTEHFASHMDVNACIYCGEDPDELKVLQEKAAGNVKRVVGYGDRDWSSDDHRGPYFILDTQEIKTTWHPVGM